MTPTGAVALDRAEQAHELIEAEILHTLSTEERATLRRLLARALADVEPNSTPSAQTTGASSDEAAESHARAAAVTVAAAASSG
jgi:hypothetical protein